MKRFFFFALASVIGCATTREGEPDVRAAFERFSAAVVAGNFEQVYDRMSDVYRSELVYRAFLDLKSPIAVKWYQALPQEHRSAFEAWYTFNRTRFEDARLVTPLPEALLRTTWPKQVGLEEFEAAKDRLKKEFDKVSITMIGVDGSLATVNIKNIYGGREYYELVNVGGDWKMHHHGTSPQ